MAVFGQLWENREDYQSNLAFYRRTLLYMQQDPGNEDSQCITTFDEFITLSDNLYEST